MEETNEESNRLVAVFELLMKLDKKQDLENYNEVLNDDQNIN